MKKDNDAIQYQKGKDFEDFVERMFPDRDFEIIQRADLEGSKMPDLYIRDRKSREKFWVEAKWRARLYDDKFKICEPDRLEAYRDFQKGVKPETVFMVLGLGGNPSMPDRLFCLPLEELEYPTPYRSILQEKEHKHATFRYERGKLY